MLDLYSQFREIKSFEVAFVNDEDVLQKLYCSVNSIDPSNVVVSANNKQNPNVFAKEGYDLKLYIYTDNGIYSATSKILSVSKGLLNTEYTIAYPTNSKHSQRREFFRADLNIDFKLKVIRSDDSTQTEIIEQKTKNICGKGMCYVAEYVFPEHESLEVELDFDGTKIHTLARLVYSKPFFAMNRQKFIHAFTFTTIDQKDIDFIVKKCFLYQLDMKKKQNI